MCIRDRHKLLEGIEDDLEDDLDDLEDDLDAPEEDTDDLSLIHICVIDGMDRAYREHLVLSNY